MNHNIIIIKEIIQKFLTKNNLSEEVILEKPNAKVNAHLTTNVAMILAKLLKKNPRELAQEIKDFVLKNDKDKIIKEIEIAGPGFLNFLLTKKALDNVLNQIFKLADKYGNFPKTNLKYNLELVSANPTGFLHVGHARNAAVANSVGEIFKALGHDVEYEYYVNDAGNQINILAISVYNAYLEELGLEKFSLEESYAGVMYNDFAKTIIKEHGDKFKGLSVTESNKLSDEKTHEFFREISVKHFLKEISQQLKDFNVPIDHYSSEKAMYTNKVIDNVLKKLAENDATYEKDNALWLKTTEFGDDKDRVLVKSDGSYTYLLPDIAGHSVRYERTKPDHMVNFFGADHHSYILRISGSLKKIGIDKTDLEVVMIQMVRLIKDGAEFKMSKRKGTAVWLQDLIEDYGADPIRYMLISKSPQSHMEIDVDLFENQSAKNPVFYAKYATARCSQILNNAKNFGIDVKKKDFKNLKTEKELAIINELDLFASYIKAAGDNRHPHIMCEYVQNLARNLHSYYNETKILDAKILKFLLAELL